MYDIERQEKILEILRREKSCSVAELAKLLCFSEATIRRDLNALDKEMKVRKTFGGAIIMEAIIPTLRFFSRILCAKISADMNQYQIFTICILDSLKSQLHIFVTGSCNRKDWNFLI